MGIVLITIFTFAIRFTYSLREIRVNGELVYTPIVSIGKSRASTAKVIINERELNAGSISKKSKAGDIIAVRYIEGKTDVVQERVELWRFYLWFGLESFLLFCGIILIVSGFKRVSWYG